MNTRSVTKKLDTIGSTSQTPSIYDLIDWKEWPVHGMHERPVFHSELGLGTQYSDNRFIKNLDTITDTNASDESEAESEDHDEDFLRLKKLIRQRIKDLESHKIENSSDNNIDIFQLTMHKNLHLVLAFCTQISSHEYQTQIQNKLKLLKAKITADSQDWSKNETNESKNENIDKPILINNSVPAGNIPTNSKTKNISNNTYKVLKFISARMEPAKCLITPRKTVANIQNNQITNIQNNCSKLQDIIRGSSKNALILLKIQEPPKVNSKRIENSCQNNQCAKPLVTNLNWNDSTINNDSMMNITSFYENFLPVEEVNYLQESDEKTVLEIKDNDQNKINEINQNINETPETMTINYCDSIKGIDSQNCDSIGKQNNYNFTDQRKFGLIGDFYHKSTAIVDEQKIKESDENQEILEALDLSTVRTRKEVSKSKKEEETLKSRKENIKSKKEVIKGGKSREEIKTKKETKLKQDSIKTKEEILKAKKENLKSSEEILKINETLDGKKEEILNKEDLQTLLESTIILYCIITGADQENVANYIDTLNAVENLEWLKEDSTASK
ncbi:early endosome antigen 1-like [Leptopilina heterotoma]|uniref:early endosome antigen 1-like n=1 Tax=Leptopilina heterotoma TaxID=63436 RepID=UPI001CA9D97F|nr:early endosome antigen 1-like [Leptopilina heterotoma]